MKTPYTVRLDPVLLKEIQELASERSVTVVSIFETALKSFLSAPNPEDPSILARIEALEKEVLRKPKRYIPDYVDIRDAPGPEPTRKDSLQVPRITIQEVAKLTGYSQSTLSSKFARAGVKAVDRVDGNRAGLYDKDEVMEKIGKK